MASSTPSSLSSSTGSTPGSITGSSTPTSSFIPPPPETTTSPFTPATTTFQAGNAPSQNNNGGGLATSASLYLYTFLATLVLLLSVSGAIVVRSFVLRRRHRRMVEEAIRNGTWVPPAPPSRPVRVDLSKKPKMWEAFIDSKGAVMGMRGVDGQGEGAGAGAGQWYTPGGVPVVGAGKGVAGGRADINQDWQHEHSREWDTIKPFSAAYVAPGKDEPDASARLGSSPSTTSVNRSAPATPVIAAPSAPREPLHRALITSVRHILSPTPQQTSPLPGPPGGANSNSGVGGEPDPAMGAGQVMAELNSRAGKAPTAVRVAVLIAMPKQPGAHESHGNGNAPEDEEQPLPHIEVGVAEVLVVSHELSAGGKAESSSSGKPGVRGSVGSQESDLSEV